MPLASVSGSHDTNGIINGTHISLYYQATTFMRMQGRGGGIGSTGSVLILDTIRGLHMQYLSTSSTASDSNTVFTQKAGR